MLFNPFSNTAHDTILYRSAQVDRRRDAPELAFKRMAQCERRFNACKRSPVFSAALHRALAPSSSLHHHKALKIAAERRQQHQNPHFPDGQTILVSCIFRPFSAISGLGLGDCVGSLRCCHVCDGMHLGAVCVCVCVTVCVCWEVCMYVVV